MRPLKIGIDIHSIGSQKGGNETYYRELIREMAQLSCTHNFYLYYTHPGADQQIPASRRFTVRRLKPASPWFRIPFAFPWYVRQDELDVFHAQFIVPPFLKCKTVTTVPDIAYEHFPESFPAHQRALLKLLVTESVRRADHVITVSEYSKKDIAETYGLSAEKITVIYEGAGDEFVPLDKAEARECLARKYSICGEFILYLGRLQARKNLVRLVDAYAQVRQAGFRQKLVLAGKPDSLFEPVLTRIRELELQGEILLTGYIAPDDVPKLYNAAKVFVYPSYFEGFGLPVLEAMGCGTPVITSRGSSLEEVAQGAALLVDPLDAGSIADGRGRGFRLEYEYFDRCQYEYDAQAGNKCEHGAVESDV